MRSVRTDVLQNVWKALDERLNEVFKHNGGHIKHLYTQYNTSKVLECCFKKLHSFLYNKNNSSIFEMC